jgi:hypothetical protein
MKRCPTEPVAPKTPNNQNVSLRSSSRVYQTPTALLLGKLGSLF